MFTDNDSATVLQNNNMCNRTTVDHIVMEAFVLISVKPKILGQTLTCMYNFITHKITWNGGRNDNAIGLHLWPGSESSDPWYSRPEIPNKNTASPYCFLHLHLHHILLPPLETVNKVIRNFGWGFIIGVPWQSGFFSASFH